MGPLIGLALIAAAALFGLEAMTAGTLATPGKPVPVVAASALGGPASKDQPTSVTQTWSAQASSLVTTGSSDGPIRTLAQAEPAKQAPVAVPAAPKAAPIDPIVAPVKRQPVKHAAAKPDGKAAHAATAVKAGKPHAGQAHAAKTKVAGKGKDGAGKTAHVTRPGFKLVCAADQKLDPARQKCVRPKTASAH